MRLKVGCGGAVCHEPEFADFLTDLTTVEGMASRLINVDKKIPEVCDTGNTKLVNPAKPASGVLFDRLTTEKCGLRMPPAEAAPGQHLSDTQRAELVACLKGWLEPQLQ